HAMAFDKLTALVRRHDDAACNLFAKVLGRAYAEARFSLEEFSTAMGMPKPDAIVFLEEHGFARHLDEVRLSEKARAERYQAIRSDRLARANGAVVRNGEALIVRNVIASQRIEDIDARRWVSCEEA